MPKMTKEELKEYDRLRFIKHKQDPLWVARQKVRQKEQYEKHKAKELEKKKAYYLENRETILQDRILNKDRNNKARIDRFANDPEGAKKIRIGRWKCNGRILSKFNDWDKTHENFMETKKCELCNILLVGGNKTVDAKCLDHDHESRYERFVCCVKCNAGLGKRDTKHFKVLRELNRYHLFRFI